MHELNAWATNARIHKPRMHELNAWATNARMQSHECTNGNAYLANLMNKSETISIKQSHIAELYVWNNQEGHKRERHKGRGQGRAHAGFYKIIKLGIGFWYIIAIVQAH